MFLQKLQDTMTANTCSMILRPPSDEHGGLILSTGGFDDKEILAYKKHFFAMDPFVGIPSGTVVSLDEFISENDGIRVVSKSLQVSTSSDTRKMRDLIKQAIASQNGSAPSIVEAMRIQRPSGLSDLGIVIRSVPPAEWSEGKQCPSVVIFISDPEKKSRAPQEIVKTLFDLTPAEAQLAMLLANGLTVDETSEELCISRNTARVHLRSIFSKTGVTRQTMLVRLILRSVATLG